MGLYPIINTVKMVLAAGIEVQASPKGGGKTLVATKPIKKGEMVWREDLDEEKHYSSTPRTWAWIQALPEKQRQIYCHFMYKTGEQSISILFFPSLRVCQDQQASNAETRSLFLTSLLDRFHTPPKKKKMKTKMRDRLTSRQAQTRTNRLLSLIPFLWKSGSMSSRRIRPCI